MGTHLWLLRHAAAEPHGTRPDAERRLTDRGERQARDAGLALVALGARFDAILTSPKVRALDTARLAAEAWGGEIEIELVERLASEFDAATALDLVAGEGPDARVLAVGHEPDMSGVVASLTGARIDLKKGGIAVLRIQGGGAELLALLRPHELALIAGNAGVSIEGV